jgi:hypothetical protein
MSPSLIDHDSHESISEDEDLSTEQPASEGELQKTELDILGEIDLDNKEQTLPDRFN